MSKPVPLRTVPVIILLGLLSPFCAEAATPSYEQTLEELSRAVGLYRSQNQSLVRYDVVFRRDPMQALVDDQGHVINVGGIYNSLTLQGIIRSEGLNLVLINDEFFGPGDTVGSYKILAIQPEGLVALRDGKRVFIPLYFGDGSGGDGFTHFKRVPSRTVPD